MTRASQESPVPSFTLTEVLWWKRQARRLAADGAPGYFYDGSSVWGDGGGGTLSIWPADAPQDGWRHADRCTCPVCSSFRSPVVSEEARTSGTSEPTSRRLAFGSQAAAVQLELSQLIVNVATLFTRIHVTGIWPSSASVRSRAWAERGVELVDDWMGLEPPKELAPVWEELSAQFDVLAGLLQAVPELGGQADGKLSSSVTGLQSAFNRQLHVANALESRLHEEERKLRELAQRSSVQVDE